jgi:fatty acid desaturase
LVADLFTPSPLIYWTDFLLSILGGHVMFGLVRLLPWLVPGPDWLIAALRALAFVACCLLYYRSTMFIHELVHLKRGTFGAFRFVWNLLCGIPLLMPSFVYYHHIEHHRRTRYGTDEDGEYLPLASSPPWHLLVYLTRPFYTPFLVVLRFALVTPVTWLLPSFRGWVYRRASSVVVNPGYLRPPSTPQALRVLRLQETLCFLWCTGLIVLPVVFLHRLPLPFLLQSYLTAVCILYLNGFRTLGQHRWRSPGAQLTMAEQVLDSVNYPYCPYFTELWGPVGLRFHALHHVFPTMPYHSLAEAHRRLMKHVPPDSPYRHTEEPGLLAALWTLWRLARQSARPAASTRFTAQPSPLGGPVPSAPPHSGG